MLKAEGIKVYALCPFYAETALVTDSMSISDIEKRFKGRVLQVPEVGAAMVEALKADKQGSVYAIIPDVPIMDLPSPNQVMFYAYVAVGMLMKKVNPGMAIIGPGTVGAVIIPLAFLFLYILYLLTCWVI